MGFKQPFKGLKRILTRMDHTCIKNTPKVVYVSKYSLAFLRFSLRKSHLRFTFCKHLRHRISSKSGGKKYKLGAPYYLRSYIRCVLFFTTIFAKLTSIQQHYVAMHCTEFYRNRSLISNQAGYVAVFFVQMDDIFCSVNTSSQSQKLYACLISQKSLSENIATSVHPT